MTSNILAGERRWASARRTGMTVLGKVSVPKPLNLPSQRLENHGLDPNVEIVPKGSAGWGSRPSSSASNPWGSSTLSPNADGSVTSPGHLSGRPSSGGSGSRPSTAGSERTHERSGNAWGLSSRPSSASGTSASNQTSLTSLRPHSAETRPTSSQLSRFAEPVSDPVARGQVGTAERVVVTSSENEKFALTSGDFPTLSSSKESSGKNFESRDQGSHSRPSSASGRVAQKKEWADRSQADVNSGTANTWKRDAPQNAGDGIQPSMENWHGEPQKYHDANITPPQFDAWHGPPMNTPAGVWYRRPPPGPPYGAPVPPVAAGGFPVEPFPYYCPQIPPAVLANSHSVPLPGAGPRGPRPKNGEMFRPQLPDAFVRPGMPFRPGFYHGPMPFEGYYGPPMGFCNPNEREVPFRGTAGGPSVYNKYPAPNTVDTGNSHGRTGMSGSTAKALPEQVETANSDDASGQYKVLLKQNNEWDAKERGENREHMPTSNSTHSKKGGQLGMSFRKNEWGADHNSEDDMYLSNTQAGNSSQCTFDDPVGYSPDTIQVKPLGSAGHVTVEDSWTKKAEPPSHGMSQASSASGRGLTATATDSTLMQKIEGLNEKVRATDGRNDGVYTSKWEEQKGITGVGALESVSVGDKTSQLTSAPRRPYEGVRSKNNDNEKRRFNSPDVDGWLKKPAAAEAFNVRVANDVSPSNVQESRINPVVAAVENSIGKSEGESLTEELDCTDNQAQRTKMRELAKQKAIQLQKEEEERTREQKAKAFAKLEELNRRTQGVNALNLTAEKALPTDVSQHEKERSQTYVDSSMGVVNSQSLSSALASSTDIVSQVSETTGEWGNEAPVPVSDLPIQTSKAAPSEPVVSHGPLLPLKQEMHNASDVDCKATPQLNEAGASRQKRNIHKAKQNTPPQMDTCEKAAVVDATTAPKDPTEIAADVIAVVAPAEVGSIVESNLPNISNIVADSSTQQRRKSNRSSKNKHKLDSASSISALPLTVPKESDPVEVSTENEISGASQPDLDSVSIGAAVITCDGADSSNQHSTLHSEGAHGKISNHRKPQQSRRFSRNQQTNRFVDKYHGNDNVMWAPVRSQSKPEPATEMGQKIVQESVTSTKTDNQVLSNLKSRRAEIERYVPKPVAKELAQQGGVQQSVPSSVGVSISDETAEKAEPELSTGNLQPGGSATGNVVSITESREGDSKHNKQPKVHGAWRQRGPTDSLHVKDLQNVSSSTSNTSTNAQISGAQNQSVKTELTSVKADRKVSREFSASDGGNMLNDSNAAAVISPHGRDQGVNGKGKRHALKGERNKGDDNEHEKNLNYQETDRNRAQLGDPGIHQTGKVASSRESRGLEERTSSHWQPKSNSVSNNIELVSRTNVNQSSTGEVSGFVKDHSSQPWVHVPQHVNNSSQIDPSHSQIDPSGSENKIFSEVANVGHQGHGKERKLSSSKGRPYTTSAGPVADESTHHVNADTHNKQHGSSDFRRNRNQNNRPSTNRESRADWNQERQRQNAHYEYQPVGPYNNNKAENFEDVSGNMGPTYKDRGQSHPKRGRGNFHGRQSDNVRVDAAYG